jgi:hypothetical protein
MRQIPAAALIVVVVAMAIVAWLLFSDAAPAPPVVEPTPAEAADDGRAEAPSPTGATDPIDRGATPAEPAAVPGATEPGVAEASSGDPAEAAPDAESDRSSEAAAAPGEPIEGEDEEGAEEPSPGAGLTSEAIQDGVREQLGEIRECYEQWLKRNPDLEGELVVRFTIVASEEEPDLGVVSEADIADSWIDHVWMEGCVASVMESAQFPAPADGGEVEVNYPFSFSSK